MAKGAQESLRPNVILISGAGEHTSQAVASMGSARNSLEGKGFTTRVYQANWQLNGHQDTTGVLARVEGVVDLARQMGGGVRQVDGRPVNGPSTSVIGFDQQGAALGVLTLVKHPDVIDYAVGLAGRYALPGNKTALKTMFEESHDGTQAIEMVEDALVDLSNQPGDGDRMLSRILTITPWNNLVIGVNTIYAATSIRGALDPDRTEVTAGEIIGNRNNLNTIVEFIRGPQVSKHLEMEHRY